MTLLVARKRVGGPHIPSRESGKQQNSMPMNQDGDGEMDFGFGADDYEDDGPPYEPPCELAYEPPLMEPNHEPSGEKPVSASIPLKKPLRKPAAPVKDIPAEAPAPTPAAAPRKTKGGSDRIQLSCLMSHAYHRRLKIYSIMSSKSVLSILEGWIDENCPPLPEP